MRGIPETVKALREAGYEYNGEGRCRGCDRRIEWWITPDGKNMPVSVAWKHPVVGVNENVDFRQLSATEIRISHFSDCPEVGRFRKK